MTKDEVEKLLKEAERFKSEDEKNRKKIEAKNTLENYTYSIKNTLKDEKLKDKITDDERTNVSKEVEEIVKWMEMN